MASISTFSDPLSASTQNTALWSGNFGTLSWSPSGWTVTNPVSYTGYGGQLSTLGYDLTGAAAYCHMSYAGDQSIASLETIPIQLSNVAQTNQLFWYINVGTLAVFKKVAGVQTQIASTTYNANVHNWFQIRELSGTTFFDYSTDGVNWTNFTSLANPFAVTSLGVQPSLGTYALETKATTATWISFNTPNTGDSLYRHVAVGDGMSRSEVAN